MVAALKHSAWSAWKSVEPPPGRDRKKGPLAQPARRRASSRMALRIIFDRPRAATDRWCSSSLLPLELSVEGRELSHELGGQPLEELALTSGHHPLDRCIGLLGADRREAEHFCPQRGAVEGYKILQFLRREVPDKNVNEDGLVVGPRKRFL